MTNALSIQSQTFPGHDFIVRIAGFEVDTLSDFPKAHVAAIRELHAIIPDFGVFQVLLLNLNLLFLYFEFGLVIDANLFQILNGIVYGKGDLNGVGMDILKAVIGQIAQDGFLGDATGGENDLSVAHVI